jgi:hypothetical protein
MATSYKPRVVQVNEEQAPESSLDLTQHPHDEDPKPRDVRAHLEINPPQAWYYHISAPW